MALGDIISRLAVNLSLETVAFEKGATRAEKQFSATQKKFAQTAKKFSSIGKTMSLAITAPLAGLAVKSVQQAQKTQAAMAQVEAALASMGPVAGKTADELQRAAQGFEGQSLLEADVILKDVTANLLTFGNVAGDQFDRAQQAAIDMATRLDKGPREAAVQVGKALNDPIKGISALSDAGVQFSQDQQAMIKSLVKTGDVAGAQAIILGELEKQFGGAAAAAQNADPVNKFADASNRLTQAIGEKLLPALTPLIDKLVSAIDWFTGLPEPVQEGAVVVGGLAAALGPLFSVFGSLTSIVPLATKLLTLLFAHPVILGAAAVVGGIYLAWKNWDKIADIARRMYQGVKTWLFDKLGPIMEWVRDKVEKVEAAFGWMADQVVLNSHVPDMVRGIGSWMAKLQTLMVDPAARATETVETKFRTLAQNVSQLVDRLYPEFARLRQMQKDLDLIDQAEAAGQVDEGFARELRRQSRRQARGDAGSSGDPDARPEPAVQLDEIAIDWEKTTKRATDGILDSLGELGKKSKATSVKVIESFRDMAQRTLQSLRSLVDGIKNGDFFDILGGIVDLILNLGTSGVFGKGFADKLNSAAIPGYATGTRSAARGLAWVGERGPELVRFNGGERVYNARESASMMGGGRPQEVRVVPSPYFDVVVDGRIVRAAPGIAEAGAGLAGQRAQFMRTRRLA